MHRTTALYRPNVSSAYQAPSTYTYVCDNKRMPVRAFVEVTRVTYRGEIGGIRPPRERQI